MAYIYTQYIVPLLESELSHILVRQETDVKGLRVPCGGSQHVRIILIFQILSRERKSGLTAADRVFHRLPRRFSLPTAGNRQGITAFLNKSSDPSKSFPHLTHLPKVYHFESEKKFLFCCFAVFQPQHIVVCPCISMGPLNTRRTPPIPGCTAGTGCGFRFPRWQRKHRTHR